MRDSNTIDIIIVLNFEIIILIKFIYSGKTIVLKLNMIIMNNKTLILVFKIITYIDLNSILLNKLKQYCVSHSIHSMINFEIIFIYCQ